MKTIYGDIKETTFINEQGFFDTKVEFIPDSTGIAVITPKSSLRYGRCRNITHNAMLYRGKLK